MSALKSDNVDKVFSNVKPFLPDAEAIYSDDDLTDKSIRFLAAEFIREKLTKRLGQELPYHLTVTIERMEESNDRMEINALVWIDKDSQKPIVIGKNGETLKFVGQEARKDIQKLLQQRVHLEIWVKVKKNWFNDENALKNSGISPPDFYAGGATSLFYFTFAFIS